MSDVPNPPVDLDGRLRRISGRCPFDQALLAARMSFNGMPLTDEETARCLAARKRVPHVVLETVTVPCAPVPLSDDVRPAYRLKSHNHADLQIGGHRVHLEAVYQELGGPGGINREVRIYVDGVLQGRAHNLGRLGGSVNTFPVVARLDRELVVTVEPVRWDTFTDLVVQIRGVQGTLVAEPE